MPEVPRRTTGDEVELGTLLALLHGADDRFRTVQATYRTWRQEQRAADAAPWQRSCLLRSPA